MFEPEQTILLSSNLLWSPWLFDGLGASGDLGRDIVLFAALTRGEKVELHLPAFCEAMGYDRANLLRPCTPAQVEQIRKTGLEEKYIKTFSNVLGLALVMLSTRNFFFPPEVVDRGTPEERTIIRSYKIIDHLDLPSYKIRQGVATTITFTLSKEIQEENRYEYKTIYPAQYLGLRTQGGAQRAAGHPDHAARRVYLRLLAKRQYWDYLVSKGAATPATALDDYQELVEAAGLRPRNSKGISYNPEKKIAYELKAVLRRVGALPSIGLVPKVLLGRTGKYEVSWVRLPITKPNQVAAAPAAEAPLSLAPAAPAPEKPRRGRPPRPKPAQPVVQQPARPAAAPPAPKQVYVKPVGQQREKLLTELEDAKKALNWLRSPDGVESYRSQYKDDQLHSQHVEQARQALVVVQNKLTEAGSKM